MRRMRDEALILLALVFAPTARAAPIFYPPTGVVLHDGGTYQASEFPGSSVSIDRASLNVGPGAKLLAIGANLPSSSVLMTGGEVSHRIRVDGGRLEISGGTVRGGVEPTWGTNAIDLNGTARISGGTFIGGDGGTFEGDHSRDEAKSALAVHGTLVDGRLTQSDVTISGGKFIGGTGVYGRFGGTSGYSLQSEGNTTVTGGQFLSPIAISGAYGGTTDFVGSHLSFKDDTLAGSLANGDAINARVYLNKAIPLVSDDGSTIRFVPEAAPRPPSDPTPVPEPGSWLAFAVLACLPVAGRQILGRRNLG